MDMPSISSVKAAAEYGYEKIIREVFGPNLEDVNETLHKNDPHKIASIHDAIRHSNEKVLREIIGLNLQDINAREGKHNRTPLHVAVDMDNLRFADILLQQNCDINAADKYGMTALHLAIKNRAHQMVGLLLHYGTDVNPPHRFKGMTPLYMAVDQKCLSIVTMLLKEGASIEEATVGKVNVLDQAFNISHRMRSILISYEVEKIIAKNPAIVSQYSYTKWSENC